MPALGAAINNAKGKIDTNQLSLLERNLEEEERRRQLKERKNKLQSSFSANEGQGPQDPAKGENWEIDLGAKTDEYHDTKLGRFMKFCEPFIIFLIVANAAMMGVGTFDFVMEDANMVKIFDRIDQYFLIVFSVECSLALYHYLRWDRISYKGGNLHFEPMHPIEKAERSSDIPWIVFDALVVILSWSFNEISIIRAFRILRALRLIAKIESMRRVVQGLVSVGPKLGMVAFLLMILFLLFGIMFSELFGTAYDDGITRYNYWGNFNESVFTLFQFMCFDTWHKAARPIMAEYWYAWMLIILWCVISGFMIMNLIIAIICESLATMSKEPEPSEDDMRNSYTDNSNSDGEPEIDDKDKTLVQVEIDYKVYKIQQLVTKVLEENEELTNRVVQVTDIVKRIQRKYPRLDEAPAQVPKVSKVSRLTPVEEDNIRKRSESPETNSSKDTLGCFSYSSSLSGQFRS
jgi:hypothetical protein